MLSRVAEALFWVGRYVERAEDTARLLDVHFHEVLEDPGVDEARACAVLLAVMGVPGDTAGQHRDSRSVLELLGYEADSSSSIVGALSAAWQNARSAREALSADIWECLNSTHNSLPARVAAARDFGPAPFFSYVRERAANVAGYVEASMSRDTSYDALILGRNLERVAGVSTAATYTNSHPTRTRRMPMTPVCSHDVSAVLYACVRRQAFENSLSADMLAGRRELLAGVGPGADPQDKAERVPAARSRADLQPGGRGPRQITKRASSPSRRARSRRATTPEAGSSAQKWPI